MIDETVRLVSQAAIPMSLVVLGMGLSEYGVRAGWRQSAAIVVLKLAVAPFAVYVIARALALPTARDCRRSSSWRRCRSAPTCT